MAYRSRRTRVASRRRTSRSPSRSYSRRRTTTSRRRSSSSRRSGHQTLRIVLEQPGAAGAGRMNLQALGKTAAPAPKGPKF